MREHWMIAYLCVAAGCFSPTAPSGFPCGDGFTCPTGQTCDLISNECGPASDALVWRDDTAADFAVTGAYVDEVTIERQGFVGPAAFLSGGLRVTGYDGLLVPDPSVQYDTIVANPPTGVGLERDLQVTYTDLLPPGLNVTNADNVTIAIEGEIELEVAGTWRFRLTANDRGFFEIEAAPGSNTFMRLIDDVDTGTVGTFTAPTAGWYRIRGAFQDAANFLDYRLEYDPPNVSGSAFSDIPVDRMRARASDLEGLIVDGFEAAFMMDHRGTLVSSASLADMTLAINSFGFPIGIGAFSLRWNGQFLIDEAGEYAFRIESAEGHRLWIDGVSVADAYSGAEATSVTTPIALAPGWHDIVLDMSKNGGPATGRIAFTIESGPQLAGSAFPADHLRPISGRGARFVTDKNLSALAIPDGPATPPTPAVRNVSVSRPADFTPIRVSAAIEVTHEALPQVEIVIDPPGAPITVADFGDLTGSGSAFLHIPLQLANAGSSFQFQATDNLTDTNIGSILGAMVTMVYDGGVPPFPMTYRYVSAVRDLGDVVAFERIAWLLRQAPDPSAVRVGLRTCDTADGCASETFADVVNGDVPDVPVRRFAQYEVRFTGNGDLPTALDAMELRYFVRGM